MQRQTVRISEHAAEDAIFIPEGRQSLTTTQQEVIQRVARKTVSQIQTPWQSLKTRNVRPDEHSFSGCFKRSNGFRELGLTTFIMYSPV